MQNDVSQRRGRHDWHSVDYVEDWISSDATRDDERRPRLRALLERAPFDAENPIKVLDVGGGYGVFSELVLQAFPRAHLTLQDYSVPMLERARKRLAPYGDRTRYVLSDLVSPAWTQTVGGPFDLAVSAICIHNLREAELIAQVYRGIREVLKPDGVFLDSDYVHTGGLEAHVGWLRDAGFTRVETEIQDERLAVMAASV